MTRFIEKGYAAKHIKGNYRMWRINKLIFTITLLSCAPSCAAESVLPIKATIVQCGKRSELEQACQRDARCCRLIEAASGPGAAMPEDVKLESIWLGNDPVADVMVTDNE